METTIKISKNVREHLNRMKIFERETYNDVIEVLIEDNLELNEETKRELEKAKGSKNWISHEEVKKRFGL